MTRKEFVDQNPALQGKGTRAKQRRMRIPLIHPHNGKKIYLGGGSETGGFSFKYNYYHNGVEFLPYTKGIMDLQVHPDAAKERFSSVSTLFEQIAHEDNLKKKQFNHN
jgi:hypothetical protein